MCRLLLQNIGAIKNVDLNLNKVTVLLGPQSSGKSTISKILCHCQWMEKRCYINYQEESKSFMHENHFINGIEKYYRMEGYFRHDSYILYEGNYVTIKYENQHLTINRTGSDDYDFPKLCYIPAERNLVTAIPNLKKYNETNDLILYFMYDWFTSREYLKQLDLSNIVERSIRYEYIKSDDSDNVYDGDQRLKLVNASSGVQSVLPLCTVAKYVMEGIYKRIKPLSSEEKMQLEELNLFSKTLTEQISSIEKELKTSEYDVESLAKRLEEIKGNNLKYFQSKVDDLPNVILSAKRKFFYQRTDLYVEEPEQNLFPIAQSRIVYWLFSALKSEEYNHSLFLTTHSPYILFAINNCLIGGLAGSKLSEEEISSVKSHASWISPDRVTIYEIHDGEIRRIQDEAGLLMNNYLNMAYREVNNEFLTMFDYYED